MIETERTISSPEEPEANSGVGGYCRACQQYGHGRFDDIRTAWTDWITDHVGCTAQGPDDEGAAL
ncbi:hypothetical protein ACWC5I_00395 [Kitasatospora sp. NPDC001574]